MTDPDTAAEDHYRLALRLQQQGHTKDAAYHFARALVPVIEAFLAERAAEPAVPAR